MNNRFRCVPGFAVGDKWASYTPSQKRRKPKYPFVICGDSDHVWLVFPDGSQKEATAEIKAYFDLLRAGIKS
jgi:hypothetical protein